MDKDSLKLKLKNALKPQPVKLAYLYGSQVFGNTHQKSDIDVAVVLAPASVATEYELGNKLSAALENRQVDVRIINFDSPAVFLRNILKDGQVILAKDDSERVKFEVQAMKKYYDSEYLRRFMTAKMYQSIKKGSYGRRQNHH